jgi:methionyl-tRNA synthetase
MSAYYLTTPIYYANDVPHIGHAYTTIAADAIARFRRRHGQDVFLLTGTDEHGVNIERIASATGGSASEHVDRVSGVFRDLWAALDISYDRFIRTTEPAHHRAVLQLWERLQASGDLYRGTYQGAHCQRCEAYYQPDELVDGACPVHELACEIVSEENWFFRLSRYQSVLEQLVGGTEFVQPRTRRNEVLAVIREGLRDLSVSRRQVRWGVGVPERPDEVIYVWVDALANYLTGVGFPDEASFERYWPAQLHLVGKEITRFHCIYWPALLLSAGLPLPKQVFAHGWLTRDGRKISKTTGNTIDPLALVTEFGSDAVRHYLLRGTPFGQDGDFTQQGFVARYNAELANGFGNLVQRASVLASRFGTSTSRSGDDCASETVLRAAAERGRERVEEAFERLALHEAVGAADDFVGEANRYLEATQPWRLARAGATRRLEVVLRTTVDAARTAAALYAPIIPRAAAEAQQRLASWPPRVGEPLFPRRNYRE